MRLSHRHRRQKALDPSGIPPQILLNIFEVDMFEKITLYQLVTDALLNCDDTHPDNQLTLF
jgi:hypothetical protein